MTQQNEVPLTAEAAEALLTGTTFDTSDGGSPLRHFKGRLENIEFGTVTYGGGGSGTRVHLKFQELEVIEAIIPFPYKTGELSFTLNSSSTTAWGIIIGSVATILGEGTPLRAGIGKVWEIRWTPNHAMRKLNRDTDEWDDVEGSAFEVLTLDGVGPKAIEGAPPVAATAVASEATVAIPAVPGLSDDDLIVELLNGNNLQAFKQAAFTDTRITQDRPALFSQLANDAQVQALIARLTAEGRIGQDTSGAYHTA